MERNPEFDDIRPYYDEEVAPVIDRLLESPQFQKIIAFLFPEMDWRQFEAMMRTFTNKKDFQEKLVGGTVFRITGQTADKVDCGGFEKILKDKACTYISNHRDIILDASILNATLIEKGFETTEIAIGDNLLLYDWIEDLVKLNKSFIVKRGVSIRQMLEVSQHLSKYIHFTLRDKNQSVWIAQREGRAKDSNDRTQESVLKMLAMGGDKSFLQNIEELNITPASFSYEYDPCDYLKAKEFQQRRDNPEFKKSQQDDFLNMQTGLLGYKGNIHLQIGNSINPALSKLDASLGKLELVTQIASLIDNEIFLNYRFYPINYIAYDRLWGEGIFKEKYSGDNLKSFDAYLQKQLDKIDLPDKDIPFLTEKILKMYAHPVKNQLSVK
ncbi:acyltransferase [Bacteroidia bacterium]|nr:acyltransferase [Bacteroidia bacterium]